MGWKFLSKIPALSNLGNRLRLINETLLESYANQPERRFRAENLVLMIWAALCVIVGLLFTFTIEQSGLLDPKAKIFFTPVFLSILGLFILSLNLVKRGNLLLARSIVLGTAIAAVLTAVTITGGFPNSVATFAIFIPIVLSYCLFGDRTSLKITLFMVIIYLIQWCLSDSVMQSIPNFTSNASHEVNMAIVLLATLLFACAALSIYDKANRKYIERAEAAVISKTNFLANTSHEIRTPMNGIIGLTEVMLRTTKLDQDQVIYMDAIHKSGTALMTVINDILDYSRLDGGYVELIEEPFNLYSLSHELKSLMTINAADKNVVIQCDYPKDAPQRFLGDVNRIRQIMINLLANAVKFTDNGRVVIRNIIERDQLECRVRIEVEDTGIGIPKHKLASIFERFTQAESGTTQKYGGTGLGLSIAQKLIELMNGRIGVISDVGSGSTFWFELRLPLADPVANPNLIPQNPYNDQSHQLPLEEADDKVQALPSSPDKKVLLISLNEHLIRQYGDVLRQHNYRVFHTHNLGDVDYWIGESSHHIDSLPVILIDGELPSMSLSKISDWLASRSANIQVIGIAPQTPIGFNPFFDKLGPTVSSPENLVNALSAPKSSIKYS